MNDLRFTPAVFNQVGSSAASRMSMLNKDVISANPGGGNPQNFYTSVLLTLSIYSAVGNWTRKAWCGIWTYGERTEGGTICFSGDRCGV